MTAPRPPAPRGITWQAAKAVARGFLAGASVERLMSEWPFTRAEIEACIRRWVTFR